MPRALSVSLFSPAWLCQFWSPTPLGVTLPVSVHITPPLQLDKVNTAITPNCPEVPALSTVQIPRLEQALLCHCLPTPIRPFFSCLGNLAPTPWVDQITLLKSEFKSFFCPSPLPQPNPGPGPAQEPCVDVGVRVIVSPLPQLQAYPAWAPGAGICLGGRRGGMCDSRLPCVFQTHGGISARRGF